MNPFRYRSYYYDAETWFYYLQSRYYDPQICRFINADIFTSTGQGLLGNNMFAYCLNSPVNKIDFNGYITISFGFGFGGNAFLGTSDGITIALDDDGNIEVQRSYSSPKERETTSIGLFNVGFNYLTLQITNKPDVADLQNVSTYLGFSSPSPLGIDIVLDAPIADLNGELIGIQISAGWGIGLDVHAAQTNTKTLFHFTWKDVAEWLGQFFDSSSH